MKKAMVEAPLGDDVLGDDPTVQKLEQLAAELSGKQSAIFTPSGTMANQIANASEFTGIMTLGVFLGRVTLIWNMPVGCVNRMLRIR